MRGWWPAFFRVLNTMKENRDRGVELSCCIWLKLPRVDRCCCSVPVWLRFWRMWLMSSVKRVREVVATTAVEKKNCQNRFFKEFEIVSGSHCTHSQFDCVSCCSMQKWWEGGSIGCGGITTKLIGWTSQFDHLYNCQELHCWYGIIALAKSDRARMNEGIETKLAQFMARDTLATISFWFRKIATSGIQKDVRTGGSSVSLYEATLRPTEYCMWSWEMMYVSLCVGLHPGPCT